MKYLKVISLFLPLTLLQWGCGSEALAPTSVAEQKIINGFGCDERLHTSAVAIIMDGIMEVTWPWPGEMPIRTVSCTGTLIAPDTVLTASHCLHPEMLAAMTGGGEIKNIKFYISFLSDLTAMVDATAQQLPELPADKVAAKSYAYNANFTVQKLQTFTGGVSNLQDVAVLFLETPVTHIQPAVVITKEEASQITKDTEVTIAGWGQQTPAPSDMFNPPPPGTVGMKICGVSHINEVGPHEMQIGSDSTTSRKCHGDSGGPTYMVVDTEFTVKERVVGITSHAYDQTDCAKGGVDTRVDAWYDWINEKMTNACKDATRSWCEVEGIIPPEYYEPEPEPEPEPDVSVSDPAQADGGPSTPEIPNNNPDDTEDDLSEGSGCAVANSSTTNAGGFFSLALLLLVFGWRRRRN